MQIEAQNRASSVQAHWNETQWNLRKCLSMNGAGSRVRTDDLLITNHLVMSLPICTEL
jgi:hypothetical protein